VHRLSIDSPKHLDLQYISCPASLIIVHSSGKVSSECPGMNQVVLMLYLANSFRSLRTPIVPANIPIHHLAILSTVHGAGHSLPLEMSLVESSPP